MWMSVIPKKESLVHHANHSMTVTVISAIMKFAQSLQHSPTDPNVLHMKIASAAIAAMGIRENAKTSRPSQMTVHAALMLIARAAIVTRITVSAQIRLQPHVIQMNISAIHTKTVFQTTVHQTDNVQMNPPASPMV